LCCATPPLLPFQLSEIARQKPRSVDQFVEMAAAIKEGEHIYRIDDSTTGIVVSGTGTLERAGWMLASICEINTGYYPDARDKGTELLKLSDGPAVVDFGEVWKQHDDWLEKQLPGTHFGTIRKPQQGACLSRDDTKIEFAYSTALLFEDADDMSSHLFMLLITKQDHYQAAIAKAKQTPSRRLYVATTEGDVRGLRRRGLLEVVLVTLAAVSGNCRHWTSS